MFVYDEKKDLKEFTLLTREIPDEIRNRITSWLKENVDISNPIWDSDTAKTDIITL